MVVAASPLPPSPTAAAIEPLKLKSTLNAAAAPFVPSWLVPEVTDDTADDDAAEYDDESAFYGAIPDEELFAGELTAEELLELEQVDEVNALLADLELMETHQELYQEHVKAREAELESERRSLAKKPAASKRAEFPRQHTGGAWVPKKNSYHGKKNMFAPIQQPRPVK